MREAKGQKKQRAPCLITKLLLVLRAIHGGLNFNKASTAAGRYHLNKQPDVDKFAIRAIRIDLGERVCRADARLETSANIGGKAPRSKRFRRAPLPQQ